MSQPFLDAYIQTIAILLVASVTAVLALHAPAATRDTLPARQVPWLLGGTALFFGLWYAAAARLAQLDVLGEQVFANGPPLLGLIVLAGGALIFLLGRAVAPARKVIDRIDQRYLMAFQGFRILGGIFLVGWAAGQIPALFAIPAGIGDILAGVFGISAARALARGDAGANRKVRFATYWGIGDFVVALGTGLVTADTAFQLPAFEAAPNIVGFYPLVMIPALFVPMFLAAHFFTLQKLSRAGRAQPQDSVAA